MASRALIIGYGSVGKRHAQILDSMDAISSVTVLSSQKMLPFETITSLEDILSCDPDYIIIASRTALHYEELCFLENNLQGKKILVEKPLFDSKYPLEVKNNLVFVGYNLRFHPILQKIKKFTSGRDLWNMQIFCGSYLPDWRPGRDYRQTSSAKKGSGGGVLLDLSHELDYAQMLAGPMIIEHVVCEKISDLEIETEDLLLLSGKNLDGVNIHITLNYFTQIPIRQILIDGEGISIRADLISNTLSVMKGGESSFLSWPKLERDETYTSQHFSILNNDYSIICSLEEGLETMHLIDQIQSFVSS
jgi:predicted dehydrogenase